MEKYDCCHCSARRKERSPEEYKKLINRLSRLEGPIRGIRAMVDIREGHDETIDELVCTLQKLMK